jgi:hypothetical protein
MSSRLLSLLVLSLALILCLPQLSPAQSTYGAISGAVTDPTGAAIGDAQVTLTSVSTAESRSQTTGPDGLYSFVNLIPGEYKIDIQKQGFKHITRQNVIVQVNQSSKVDITLAVGQVSETVEVTAETSLLQAETSSLGQVVEQRKANELPLNGRNIFNLITISPAAVAQGGSGGTPVGQNPFSWGNYQVGGSFANESGEYLDGQPLNIGYINLPIVIPTQDSIGEFKVQYNNLGADWGKFSGGIVNLSTKSGTNSWHGEAHEFLRNKVLNSNDFFLKQSEAAAGLANEPPPYVQNQYGVSGGGPIIKNKTFVFASWEQFRLRTGSVLTTTVPLTAFRQGDFSALLGQGIQLYDPYTVDTSGSPTTNPNYGKRLAYKNNQIPTNEFSKASTVMWDKYFVPPTVPGAITNNFTSATSSGGNTNQFVVRGDQNIGANTRLFGRFTYFGLLDLPTNPFGTGLCFDRCAEDYHSKLLAIDLNHSFSSNIVFDLNVAASRFVYSRAPILTGYDLTQLGWPATYNTPPDIMRTPPTPAFPFPNDVGRSQGNSAIGDHNTQYNVTPALTIIHGKHSIQVGGQYELGLDNYFQTNIASGAFAFSGSWTAANALNSAAGGGFPYADFLLGLSQNQGSFVNQTEGVAQVPAQTAGKQTYRAFYGNDTWRVTTKFTLNLGLRYELQGGWSERYNRLSYWNPNVVNATVTGCGGTVGSPCPGDALLVPSGGNNIPLDKKQFSPRVGFAYSPDSKTVIRGGYGIFWIPNYVSFALNPDNDVINLATTPFTASTNSGLTPLSTLNSTGCSLPASNGNTFANFTCSQANQGPFGPGGILPPPGRTGNTSAFVAASGSPTLAPYLSPLPGYVQQYNFDIQRQLPGQIFLDVAFAGSHGVHLPQYSTHMNQIPDSFIQQAAQQAAAKQPVTIATQIPNPMAGTSGNATIGGPQIVAGQLDRPFPQYTDVNLAGYGCCGSVYNSLQVTATRRFAGGGTLLVAYTNAKLLSNTDTLTSWLESGTTGGVGQVQDWNNLDSERSLSSQDVSQRLVISYVLDLPFGHGQKYLSGMTGVGGKVVSGWGVDGVTTFQRGFPLKIAWGGAGTSLEAANLGVSNVRPNVSSGCSKSSPGGGLTGKLNEWFNASCFGTPPAWGFGTEPRVDPTLRADGINNFDFAIFKRTAITERAGLEFRTEFFNLFNHPQFGFPGTNFNPTTDPTTGAIVSYTANGFGQVSSQQNNPRLIQFALKFIF